MFGKILASIVEGAIDGVELTVAAGKDVVKSPLRILGGDGVITEENESLAQDTRNKIDEIMSR